MNRRRLLSFFLVAIATLLLVIEQGALDEFIVSTAVPNSPLGKVVPHHDGHVESFGEDLDQARQKLPHDWRIVRAALRNITKLENFCPGKDPYKVLFGCEEYVSPDGDHPRIHKPYRNTTTTAYGFYQVIDKTWDLTNKYCGNRLTDINDPSIQDTFGICNSFRVGAMQHLLAGEIYNPRDDSVTVDEAEYKKFLCKAGREWAGTPFSPYDQIEGISTHEYVDGKWVSKWDPSQFDCDSAKDWARYEADPGSFTSLALYKEFWDNFNTELAIENRRYADEFLPEESEFVFPLKGKTWRTAVIGDAFGVVSAVRGWKPHAGQDFPEEEGYPIVSVERMVVGATYTDPNKVACGKGVYGTGAKGRSWLYCHMSEVLVSPGEVVEPGQEIGKVGSTGINSTGNHLHVEQRQDGGNIDPSDLLRQARAA